MELTTRYGYEQMNFDEVTAMLSRTYWSPGITLAEVQKGARHSALVAGIFADEMQVGYARVISDKTRFAYLCDVIVDENHRHHGIGQKMVEGILAHEELKDVYQWLLVTKDAHAVYAKAGFTGLQFPDNWMGIINTRPNR